MQNIIWEVLQLFLKYNRVFIERRLAKNALTICGCGFKMTVGKTIQKLFYENSERA